MLRVSRRKAVYPVYLAEGSLFLWLLQSSLAASDNSLYGFSCTLSYPVFLSRSPTGASFSAHEFSKTRQTQSIVWSTFPSNFSRGLDMTKQFVDNSSFTWCKTVENSKKKENSNEGVLPSKNSSVSYEPPNENKPSKNKVNIDKCVLKDSHSINN